MKKEHKVHDLRGFLLFPAENKQILKYEKMPELGFRKNPTILLCENPSEGWLDE